MVSSPEQHPMSEREESTLPLEKPVQSQYYFSHKETSNSLTNAPHSTQETQPKRVDTPPLDTDKVSWNVLCPVSSFVHQMPTKYTINLN